MASICVPQLRAAATCDGHRRAVMSIWRLCYDPCELDASLQFPGIFLGYPQA